MESHLPPSFSAQLPELESPAPPSAVDPSHGAVHGQQDSGSDAESTFSWEEEDDMGNAFSGEGLEGGQDVGRQQAVTEAKRKGQRTTPVGEPSKQEDWPFIKACGIELPALSLAGTAGRGRGVHTSGLAGCRGGIG